MTEPETLAMITLVEGATDHEYEMGELLADALNVCAGDGAEHTTVDPAIGLITGACEKTVLNRMMQNKKKM